MEGLALLRTSVDARIVDKTIDPAVQTDHLSDHVFNAFVGRNIGLDAINVAILRTQGMDSLLKRRGIYIRNDDLGTILSKLAGDSQADGACSAGNNDDLTMGIHFHLHVLQKT